MLSSLFVIVLRTSICVRTQGFQLPTIVVSDDESFVSVHCVAVMSTECKLSPQDWKAVTIEQGELGSPVRNKATF